MNLRLFGYEFTTRQWPTTEFMDQMVPEDGFTVQRMRRPGYVSLILRTRGLERSWTFINLRTTRRMHAEALSAWVGPRGNGGVGPCACGTEEKEKAEAGKLALDAGMIIS